jgi:hypothetical protein
MATKGEVQIAIAQTIRFWWVHYINTAANQDEMEVDLQTALIDIDNPRRAKTVMDAIYSGVRSSISLALARSSLQSALRPLLLSYAEILGIATTNEQEIITEIIRDMVTNSLSVQTRDITFDLTPTAGGSNVGTGSVIRLTVDENGQEIESISAAESILLECIDDQASRLGAQRNQERFSVQGEQAKHDNLGLWEFSSSGEQKEIVVMNESDSGLIQNGSFSDFNETSGVLNGDNADGTPNGLPFWNMSGGVATGLAIQDSQVSTANDNFYVNIDSVITPASLKVSTTKYIQQSLNLLNIDFERPYLPFFAYRGDLGVAPNGTKNKIWWGSKSQEWTYNGSDTGWKVTYADLDQDLWPKNWANTDLPKLKLEATTLASGYLLWDSVFLVPGTKFGNTWWWIYPGNNTPFLKRDTFAFADTEVGAIIQKGFAFAYGRHLRHSGSPTWAEPTEL